MRLLFSFNGNLVGRISVGSSEWIGNNEKHNPQRAIIGRMGRRLRAH